MFCYHSELHPPTAATHCVKANFTSSTDINVLVAKSTVLEIYTIPKGADANTGNMVLRKRCELHGEIADMAAVRFSGYPTDCLMLAFAEARISLVCFDATRDSLHTISLHYFEDDYLQSDRTPVVPPQLRLSARCAALLIRRRWVAIMPFKEDVNPFGEQSFLEHIPSAVELAKDGLPVGEHTLFDLHSYGLENVRDMCFLHGFSDTALAVLHEREPTWAGSLYRRSLTCAVTAIALSGIEQGHLKEPVLVLRGENLPHDAATLLPVPFTVGGTLVLGANTICYVTQTTITGCHLNDYGKKELSTAPYNALPGRWHVTDKSKKASAPPVCVTVASACCCLLPDGEAVIGTQDGDLLLLTLTIEANGVHAFDFVGGTAHTIPTAICSLSRSQLFLASRVADSVLVNLLFVPRRRGSSAQPKLQLLADQTEDLLFDEPTAPGGDVLLVARVIDRLLNIGPILDTEFGEAAPEENIGTANGQQKLRHRMSRTYEENLKSLELVACSGKGKWGAIHVMHRGVRPHVVQSLPVDAALTMFAVRLPGFQIRRTKSRVLPAPPAGVVDVERETTAETDKAKVTGNGQMHLPTESRKRTPETDADGSPGFKRREGEDGSPIAIDGDGQERETTPALASRTIDATVTESDTGPELSLSLAGPYEPWHTHILLSRRVDDRVITSVFATTEEDLHELLEVEADATGFISQGLTINAGTLFGGAQHLQVLPNACVLVDGGAQLCVVDLADEQNPNMHVHTSQIRRNRLFALMSTGDLHVLEFFTPEQQKERRAALLSQNPQGDTTNFELYCTRRKVTGTSGLGKITAFSVTERETAFLQENYAGDSICCVWWSCGALELYSVPQFVSLFLGRDAVIFPELVVDGAPRPALPIAEPADDEEAALVEQFQHVFATELLLTRVGSDTELPHLFVLCNTGELYLYSLFSSGPNTGSRPLSHVRLLRQAHHHVDKKTRVGLPRMGEALAETAAEWRERMEYSGLRPGDPTIFSITPHITRLTEFDGIGARGVFLSGDAPYWFLSNRTQIVTHRMAGAVQCLAAANVPFAPRGFVSYTPSNGLLNVCQLQAPGTPHLILTSHWPMRRISIGATPCKVLYHAVQNTYTVVISEPSPYKPAISELMDERDEKTQTWLKQQQESYAALSVPRATEERYSVRLYQARSWRLCDSLQLDEHEAVISARTVNLSKQNTQAQQVGNDFDDELNLRLRKGKELTPLQCIGTAFLADEDLPCRGRLLLLDVVPAMSPVPGDRRLLKLYQDFTKGPITALTAVRGYLVAAVSSKIMVYFFDWPTKRLIIAAFYDAHFFITTMTSIKSYILFGDAVSGMEMLRWREGTRQLKLMGRDYNPTQATTAEFMVDDQHLAAVGADSQGNVVLLDYNPAVIESRNGTLLLPLANMHIANYTTNFLTLRALRPNADEIGAANKTLLVYGGLSGSICYLAPVSNEASYRRLGHLTHKLYTEVPHTAGLHPRAFRMVTTECQKPRLAPLRFRSPNIIDGNLVKEYPGLDHLTQVDLGRRMGTRPDAITSLLLTIDRELPFF
eukprot:TRINITY_DN4940_c0_g1_i1.p1 TRINITY_DN4940_c0_g1~~TRINITY_DN4940_c0_g1_i1.p1  ORF type:complete len:1544 (+),score=246.46 TRINITY_DN4940_c0_g1_i1:1177-5808(+)